MIRQDKWVDALDFTGTVKGIAQEIHQPFAQITERWIVHQEWEHRNAGSRDLGFRLAVLR